jgi:periplasmic mercuric ion binding protein
MKKVIALVFVLLALSVQSNAQSGQTVIFKTSAKCGMCKKRIERDLSLSKGVEKATLNLEDKSLTVVYNGKKTNSDKLKKQISKIGYDADEVLANEKSHNALPECCQKTASTHMD